MDNIQDPSTAAPGQGQAAPAPAQVPSTDAGSVSTPSGTVVGATPPTEAQAPAEGFQMPDKFQGKSAEEIAKSYVELESHNKKVEMERANLEKMFVPEPAPAGPTQTAAVPEQPVDSTEELKKLLTPVTEQLLSPVLARLEIRDMQNKYGDNFTKLAPQVKAVKDANPTLSLEQAYKLAAFESIERTAKNEGVSQATQVAQEAVKSQVESSRPSGVRPQGIEQALQDRSVPTREIVEALGPEYAGFAAKYKTLRPTPTPR